MGAKNKVLEGDYKGKQVISSGIVLGFLKTVNFDKKTVKAIEVLDSETRTSGTSAVARGALGAAFLGPVGLLAGATAKKKGVHLVAVEFQDGKKSLMEVDKKIYKKLLALNF